jgi:YidC/Oxa1 family membrane protein insertase
MELLNSLIGRPLGALMYVCYDIMNSWAGAIIIFTILTKVIIFPLSLVAQKNSIKMVKMQPMLADIKERNKGNGTLIVEEQKALYKKEKYSTVKGILPLLIQIPIILGLINVIYNPLSYLLRLGRDTIKPLLERTGELLSVDPDSLGFSAQLRVLEQVQANPEAFSDLGIPDIISQITEIHSSFLGIDLSQIPTLASITIIVPIISGLSALVLCLVQNRYNVLQVEQGFIGKWGMTVFLVIFSAYFAWALPSGLGLYWTAGNLLSIPVLALCNLIYSPKKFIDYENRSVKVKLSKEELRAKKQQEKENKKKEKLDEKRFFAATNRHLVIYSESSGFYKYFSGLMDHILKNSDISIHYVTGDPNDKIFDLGEPRVHAYYVGDVGLIGFMMKMDADIVLMTLPDLEKYQIKRSLVRKDIEYIYLDHGMTSLHMMLREGSLDYFDTVFCYGPNHVAEVRETERVYGLPEKTLVKTGFGLLDELLIKVKGLDPGTPGRSPAQATPGMTISGTIKPKILIAPSWQKDNLLDYCLDDLMEGLCGNDLKSNKYNVIVRPHPEYVKRFPTRMQAILDKYGEHTDDGITVETDFSSNETVYTSDIVITDWSSIAQEFSYATKKPSIFINTPMKVMNPNYKKIPCVPLDISLRDEIGVSFDVDQLANISEAVDDMITNRQNYSEKITEVLKANIYDIGHASESGGDYIIGRIENKIWEKKYLSLSGKKKSKSKKKEETA